ncbi:MAG: hypothetical protein KGJ82_21285, partial [Nitrospirota bacterium]|nr:hypothetical protein [Nitrospirota bacterium]
MKLQIHQLRGHVSTRRASTAWLYLAGVGALVGVGLTPWAPVEMGAGPVYALEKYGRPLPALAADKEETATNG